ncbi:MAG: hypothetical protein Fur0010_00180 [Bdellovibrio sp.]
MSRKRSIRFRGRRQKIAGIDIDITSLLDILTIMLVFLLQSYNSSGVIFSVPKEIKLPNSESLNMNTSGVNVHATKDKIWVDDKEVLNLSKGDRRYLDQGNRRIIPLYSELVNKKQTIKRVASQAPNAAPFSGIVNLILDKSLTYSEVKRIMYTCAEAGFRQYKFVVLGVEN